VERRHACLHRHATSSPLRIQPLLQLVPAVRLPLPDDRSGLLRDTDTLQPAFRFRLYQSKRLCLERPLGNRCADPACKAAWFLRGRRYSVADAAETDRGSAAAGTSNAESAAANSSGRSRALPPRGVRKSIVETGSVESVGGTGIELGGAKPKTQGAAPTCSGYAEFESR
jgi:hypothetical protein